MYVFHFQVIKKLKLTVKFNTNIQNTSFNTTGLKLSGSAMVYIRKSSPRESAKKKLC